MIASVDEFSCLLDGVVRAASFAASAPLAVSGAVPRMMRAGFGLALAVVLSASFERSGACLELTPASFVFNALTGLSFGVAGTVVAAAAAAAGGLIDAAMASQLIGRDVILGASSGSVARILGLGFAVTFFSTGAMTRLCGRVAAASSSVPLEPSMHAIVDLVRASCGVALDIAGPALCVQGGATIVAGIVARAAPRINGLMLASPLATMLSIVATLAAVPAIAFRLDFLARAAAQASTH